MTTVAEVKNLTKQYKNVRALDDVSLELEENVIYGLLGRNGAGKTTLMSIMTAQNFATSGTVRIFGGEPYENTGVLSQISFVRESQQYPDDTNAGQALQMAALFFPNWDQAFADKLVKEFDLPLKTVTKKLSRGQLSALGVVIGLAARAPLTFFDEPYLGLDAVARQLFYDRLLEDYAEHPRTIILSSHLIDEISNLIERVILIDHGKILLNEDTETLRGRAVSVVGDADAVDQWAAGREVLHREALGRVASVTTLGRLTADEKADLEAADLDVTTVPLQQLVVRLTQKAQADRDALELEGATS